MMQGKLLVVDGLVEMKGALFPSQLDRGFHLMINEES
jgi:hypothetical protein